MRLLRSGIKSTNQISTHDVQIKLPMCVHFDAEYKLKNGGLRPTIDTLNRLITRFSNGYGFRSALTKWRIPNDLELKSPD